jgi:hypothetical protein
MDKEHKKKIEELINDHPKDCKCYERGVGVRCKAKDVGIEWFVRCLEENALPCVYSVRYANINYCRCPLRVYIAKNLGK